MKPCAQCGDASHETAYSSAVDAVVCLTCHQRAPTALEGASACPKCGRRGGARYGAQRACWLCYAQRHPEVKRRHKAKMDDWVKWRLRIIDALVRDGCFHYMTHDSVVGRCPVCGEPLSVKFIGRTTQANLTCHGGCEDAEVLAGLRTVG